MIIRLFNNKIEKKKTKRSYIGKNANWLKLLEHIQKLLNWKSTQLSFVIDKSLSNKRQNEIKQQLIRCVRPGIFMHKKQITSFDW